MNIIDFENMPIDIIKPNNYFYNHDELRFINYKWYYMFSLGKIVRLDIIRNINIEEYYLLNV